LEEDGGAYQPEERLEEDADMPAQEGLTEANMSKKEAEQQLDDGTVELKSIAE
jgi:hypothetical protein